MSDRRLGAAESQVRLLLAATGEVSPELIDKHAPGLAEGVLTSVDAVDPVRRVLRELRRLHSPYWHGSHRRCRNCDEVWPCTTNEILDRAGVPR